MSDDIFIKHGLGTFQQPYNERQPVNAQEPNIRNTQEPNIRNAQEPNIRNQQEPNIRNYQVPTTYNHRSPLTYNHRSPSTYALRSPSITQATYQARQPNTYDHRSPSTYRHPVIYQHPTTYQHRSPFTYDHRSPFTYDHRSPFTYSAREPSAYNHRSPFTYDHRSPTTYNHRSPFTYQAQQPNIRNAQEPNIRNKQSPYIANSQTPTIGTTPIIYEAIDGDTTGPNHPNGTHWGPGGSSPWATATISRNVSSGQAQAFASMGFKYQTSATTAPLSSSTTNQSRGDVELEWYQGTNAAMATKYYDIINLHDVGATPTIDDTWAWDIKYTHQISGSNTDGFVSQAPGSSASYTPNQSGGGNWTNGTWYALYAGSSSAGSFNGTVTQRYTQWLAETSAGTDGTARARSMGTNSYDIRITKSGQTTIYTNYTHGAVSCTATRGDDPL